MTAAVAALTKTINAVPVECGSVSYQASSVEYARSVVAYANSSFVDQLDQVTVAQDVLSTAKTALYAIGEPDGNGAPFTVAEEAVNTVAAAKATAARYDTDADATLAAGDAAAAAACP